MRVGGGRGSSAQDGHAVGCHQASSGRIVGARQVIEVLLVLVLAAPHHLLVLLPPDHLALVGDGLYIVLILVARLVQGVLPGKGTGLGTVLADTSPHLGKIVGVGKSPGRGDAGC